MLIASQILVSARRAGLVLAAVAAIAGCGQKGPLFLPSGPAASGRATLPQVLNPMGSPTAGNPASPASAAAPAPATAASAPR